MSKKILITGANGLLGQKLVYKLRTMPNITCIASGKGPNRLIEQNGYSYEQMDITNVSEVNKVLNGTMPDILIHTAAMTNVDACELNKEECWLQNVRATENICNALNRLKSADTSYSPHLIHLSTDFIFDGSHGPLTEEERPNPLSYYAESKLASEKLVQNSGLRWAIARTVLVYGVVDNMSRSNVVLWAKSALEKGQTINVVDDQFRTPTLAEDLADGCLLIAEKGAEGIFNISGKDFMSILELVYKVADFWKLNKTLITPSKSVAIKQPAKRPPITGFIIDKARKDLGYEPHSFEEGLQVVKKQMEKVIN